MTIYEFNKKIHEITCESDFFEQLINLTIEILDIDSMSIIYLFKKNYKEYYFENFFKIRDLNEQSLSIKQYNSHEFYIEKDSISIAFEKENRIIAILKLQRNNISLSNIEELKIFMNIILFAIEKHDYFLHRFFDDFSKASTFFFQKIPNPAMILDNKLKTILKNRSFNKFIGRDIKINTMEDFLNIAINKEVVKTAMKHLSEGLEWSGILWLRKHENISPQEVRIYIKKDKTNKVIFYYLLCSDLTTQNKIEKELNYYANYDFLTALPNRKGFNEKVENLIKNRTHFMLILIDLDKFKFINDHYGHNFGDELLLRFGKRLKNILSNNDFRCRLSGDEFIILFENYEKNIIKDKIENIFKKFYSPFLINDIEYNLTISAGITMYPDYGSSLSSIISSAEYALKKAKELEGNSYVMYNPMLKTRHLAKLSILQKLKGAILNNEFRMFYQPIFNNKGEILKVEALIRWKDFESNYIPPGVFIPIAEESGLIKDISRKVGDLIINDLKILKELQHDYLQVSVNVSLKDFEERFSKNKSIFDILIFNMEFSKNIIIEITESLFMKKEINYVEQLLELKKYGFSIALDDFGTGYSSLSYLTKLPLDIIKIDKSFILSLNNEKSRELVKIIVHMAKVLNLKVVAEGVEEKWHFDFLDNLECEYYQGFYFQKPMELSQLVILLEQIKKDKEFKK